MNRLSRKLIEQTKQFLLSFVQTAPHKAVRYGFICEDKPDGREQLREFLELGRRQVDPKLVLHIAVQELVAERLLVLMPIDLSDYLMLLAPESAEAKEQLTVAPRN